VVQIAKADGAWVVGTASTAKVEFVRSLGADEVIDHSTEDPLAGARTFDVIIDIGGNRPVTRLRRALSQTGTLVIVGGEGGGAITGGFGRQLLAPLRGFGSGQSLTTFVSEEHHRVLEVLAELVTTGSIRPVVDCIEPLERTADALRRMEDGQIRGKDVVRVTAEVPDAR
jgi:NADPH:quinone reductase-like Zn-dependent oxidoreductase